MAYTISIRGGNCTLGAPPGADNVAPLEVFRNRVQLISKWQLTPEGLEEIQRTGCVYLSVFGHTTFPVFIGSETEVRAMSADYGILPRQDTQQERKNHD